MIIKKNTKNRWGANRKEKLSKNRAENYGKGFTKTSTYYFLVFYRIYLNIFHTVSGKSLLVLQCPKIDEDMVRYFVMNDNVQLFASKYKLYLTMIEEWEKN